MFPTSSYFKGFNCPFYLSGLCERPFCHYKHGASDNGISGSVSATSGNRGDPRSRSQAHAPERTQASSDYVPAQLPVLEQQRATSIPTKPQPAQYNPSQPSSTTNASVSSAKSQAAEPSGILTGLPQKRPVVEAPNILGLGSSDVDGSPSKLPRLQEPQTPTISPFDYLKNIIEGKKPTQAVLFASTQDSSTESNSDSNSPVKSRLMPPVEIDYAPSFCHAQSKDGNAKKVNVWDREIDQQEKNAKPVKSSSGSRKMSAEQPMDDTDEEDVDSGEKGDINEVIKKELEKLKELQRQLDPKSLIQLQEHLKPLMTQSAKSDSETQEAGKDEPSQALERPGTRELKENVNNMKAAFRSNSDEVSSFDLSASFESDDSNTETPTNGACVTGGKPSVDEERGSSSKSDSSGLTAKDRPAAVSGKEGVKVKFNSLSVATTIELKPKAKLPEVTAKQKSNHESTSSKSASLAGEKFPKEKSLEAKSKESAKEEPPVRDSAAKTADKAAEKVLKDRGKLSEGKSPLQRPAVFADGKLNSARASEGKSKERTVQEPAVLAPAHKTADKVSKEKLKSSEGKSVQKAEAKTEFKKSSEVKKKEGGRNESNVVKLSKMAVDPNEAAQSSGKRHKTAVSREANAPKTAAKGNLKPKNGSSEVINLSDEERRDEEASASRGKKKPVSEGNIFQRFAVGTSEAVEKDSKSKAVERASAPSKSDNIFARLSNLASSCSVYEEDNEYVPTFVNPKKQKYSTKLEYNPSSAASSSMMDVSEYVPQFLNVTSAAAASSTEYNPVDVVDLTQTPMKDKNRMAIPDSSGEDEDDFSPSVSSSKVTRSREFTGKSSKSRLSSNVSADDDVFDFQAKKKKKKKKKAKVEEIEYVKKVKKIKRKRKEKASSNVDSQGLLQSLFGDTLEDLNEGKVASRAGHALCEPSGSGQPARPIARPSTSAQSDADVDKRRSASYFDPLKQKWFRSDGSEDVARTAANARASSSSSGENRPSLAASAASSSVVMKKKNGFFPMNAKEVMNQRIQWYEQMKMNAEKKDGKSTNAKEKESNKGASTSQVTPAKPSNNQTHGSGVTKAKTTSAQRPTMPRQLVGKLPLEVRKRYLEVFIDECLRIYDVDADAYERALDEEQAASDRSSNRTVYLNVVINIRKRLIREQQVVNGMEPGDGSRQDRPTISHQAMLGGALAAKGNFGIGPGGSKALDVAMDTLLAGDEFYDKLETFCLTEDQLVENGFPIAIGGGNVDIPNADEKVKRSVGKFQNERICARCGVNFKVDDDGLPVTKDDCYYHWGKLWKRRVAGQGIEQRYTCCGSDTSVTSCQLASQHVHEANRYCDLSHYKHAPELTSSKSRRAAPKGVYSLDCEMVYTTKGSELARVTVIDRHCKVVYEQLVLPDGDIIDCNTRFSGLKATDFEGEDLVSLHQVQRDLRRLFNAATILIGHSLESDLIALKMCHEKVIDTSVVFPHKQGLPYKRALKTLALEFLQKIIQSDVGGHDSKEDAVTCMELMKMKVKDDLRKDLRNARS